MHISSNQGHALDTNIDPNGQFAVQMPAGAYDILFYPFDQNTPRPIVARNIQVNQSATVVAHVPTE